MQHGTWQVHYKSARLVGAQGWHIGGGMATGRLPGDGGGNQAAPTSSLKLSLSL